MPKKITVTLVRKYLSDQCTPEEIEQVDNWFNSYHQYPDHLADLPADMRDAVEKKIFEKITQQIISRQADTLTEPALVNTPILFIRYRTISIAAAVLLCLGLSYYFHRQPPQEPDRQVGRLPKSGDVRPGGNHALLTLSNGKTVVLDAEGNGIIAKQGNSSISKTSNGQILYTTTTAAKTNEAAVYNKITTPVGGQYRVVLPDGTQAWLNSSSSLTYPIQFAGKERQVEMTGEVYFEVAKNAAMPFKVKSKQTQVEVLGTHFDVMAYDEEAEQKTTLLEGSVKIATNNTLTTLAPGQQAVVVPDGRIKLLKNVDVESIVAWKNGYFDFKNLDLETAMRQAARWYGITVICKGETATTAFTGRIPREVNLSELLEMLEYTGVKYHLDGKRVTFEP